MSACPFCSSDDVINFELAPAGQAMQLLVCRVCERRLWHDPSMRQPLDRTQALRRCRWQPRPNMQASAG